MYLQVHGGTAKGGGVNDRNRKSTPKKRNSSESNMETD